MASSSGEVQGETAARLPPLQGPLFVDTGAWYAHFAEDDAVADRISDILEATSVPLVTSTYVFDEVVTLVRVRSTHEHAVRAGSLLKDPGTVLLEGVTRADEQAAWHRFRARSDKRSSFTDCTSFVLMDRLGIEAVLTTDDDFAQEGYTDVLAGLL